MSAGVQHSTPAGEVRGPISADLRGLLDVATGASMSLAEIEAHLKDRAYFGVPVAQTPSPVGCNKKAGFEKKPVCKLGESLVIEESP